MRRQLSLDPLSARAERCVTERGARTGLAINSKAFSPIQTFINMNRCNITPLYATRREHVSRISKEYYVNYFNSSHRELGPPVVVLAERRKLQRHIVPSTIYFRQH